jgi:flagellar biosynthetic protein FliP
MMSRRAIAWLVVLVTACTGVTQAHAQPSSGFGPSVAEGLGIQPPSPSALLARSLDASRELNPLEILDAAGQTLPSVSTSAASAGDSPGRGLSPLMNVLLVLTVITLAPSILLMCTCFVRMIMVLALLRQAIGAPGLPPPQVTLALSLFMTLVVMTPTIDRVYAEAITPYREGRIVGMDELWTRAKQPVRDFMFAQIDASGNWSSVYMMLNLRGIDTSEPDRLTRAEVDMISLVPAFMLSELKVAFVMGFKIYLPFLVIDMVISSLLISMGMMMLPPVMISLPFKLLLFVLVDGWQLVVGGLMSSFVQPAAVALAPAVPPMFTALAAITGVPVGGTA